MVQPQGLNNVEAANSIRSNKALEPHNSPADERN
jgi:hypothetical protein